MVAKSHIVTVFKLFIAFRLLSEQKKRPNLQNVYNQVVQTAIDNYNQRKEDKEGSGGNYYNTMGARLDGCFVRALCESINMGRTSYTEAYRLTNTSRKTFPDVVQRFGGVECQKKSI